MFLAYVMWRLLQDDPKVQIVLQLRGQPQQYLTFGNSCSVISSAHAAELVDDPAVVYLIDSDNPFPIRGRKTLEVSSPNPQYYKEFVKYLHPLYMPTWTLEELGQWHAKLTEGIVPQIS